MTLSALLKNRAYLSVCLVSCFLQASHGAYYVISAIAWRAAGYSESAIAWLWVEGVVAEILLLAAGKHLLRRYSTVTLLAVGGIGATLRWSLTAATNELWLLILLQALHALSFAIVHLASVTTLARVVPPERLASAQALWTAVYAGIFISGSMALAGWLYDLHGQAAAYGTMAGFSVAGLIALLLLRRQIETQKVP